MRAINLRAIRQSIELFEAAPHLCHRALKDTPAPQCKQAVADKGMACHMIGDMPQRMTADIENVRLMRAQMHNIAIIDGAVDMPGILSASPAGPIMVQPVFSFSSRLLPA